MTANMVYALMIPLVAFAVWRRLRSSFGRQPVRRNKMIGRIVFLSIFTVFMAIDGLRHPIVLEGLAAGLVAGAALSVVGLRLTSFERDAAGNDLYLPNPWVGGVLSALLLGRLAWRFLVDMPRMGDPAHAAPAMGNSPLTLLVFGLTFGYYIGYFAGLLVHHRRFERAQLAAS